MFERELGLRLTRCAVERLTADRPGLILSATDLAALLTRAGCKAVLPTTASDRIRDKLRTATEGGIYCSALVADGAVYFADTSFLSNNHV